MNENSNPYQAPVSRVADPFPEGGDFVPEGLRLEAREGMNWLSQGWDLFRQAPGMWILITLVFVVIFLILGSIPLLGIVLNLVIPVFTGGFMLGCKALEEGEELRFGHLFAGFSNQAGSLIMVGLIYLVGLVAVALVVMVIAGAIGFGSGVLLGKTSMTAGLLPLVVGLLVAVLVLPLAMAVCYAPALVLFHRQGPFDALKSSFSACLKNFMPFLVYGLAFLVLAVLATLPVGLGWFILIPVTQASIYASYKSLFTRS
ncbi:MAG TPA: BPSS1780 family membrane protein [Rhodocyclaceae bacterium]|nr:BPSS1780 family membrane protein [Rhodocyclaceae bacterium]